MLKVGTIFSIRLSPGMVTEVGDELDSDAAQN